MLGRKKRTGWPVRVFVVILFLIPLSIGLGFGVLTWQHNARLLSQRQSDRGGVPITANVVTTKVEAIKHTGSSRTAPTNYFCHIAVTFTDPGTGQAHRAQFRLEDDTICTRYKTGDSISARTVPGKPQFMVLDEGRLAPVWFWITFAISVLCIAAPIYVAVLLRRAGRRQKTSR